MKQSTPQVKRTWYNDPQNASALHRNELEEWQSNKENGV
jgi:hypothetical protein